MKETFNLTNRNFVADIKRTAAATYPKQEKLNKNLEKIAELQEENECLQAEIDGANIAIRRKTKTATNPEGFTALDLCKRVVDSTGKYDKNGFEIKKTSYILNWPDTVIPPTEGVSCEGKCSITEAEDAAAQDAVEAQAEYREEAEAEYNNAMAEEE